MQAILVQKGTKCACNFSHDRDHICMQSYLMGTIYACNFENFQITFKVIVLGQKAVWKILVIVGIFGPYQIRLQAYMVPIVTEIAGIFGPLLNQDCMHIWSLSWSRLQAYMVPILTEIAGIFGPFHNQNCMHNCPPPICQKHNRISATWYFSRL